MRKIMFFLAILFAAVTFTSCVTDQTYRLRMADWTKKVIIINQPKIKGLRVGDTVQLTQSVHYPYDWEIKQGAVELSDTSYFVKYERSNGDTASLLISKRIAVIEELVK